MPVNSIFHTSNSHAIATEQNLYRDLLAEAIQIFGHDVHYLDRTIVAEDTLLGEDVLSKFSSSAKIEMYVENAEGGYEGERELMNRFGLQNLSDVTFVVAKHRFQQLTKQITIESGTDTTGGAILLESGTIDMSSDAIVFEGETFYILNETDATDSDRPLEGDLIFHPILKKLFSVNFVDHDEPFHQLDNNPAYRLRCRTFDYSSEILDTGIDAIDAIEDALSTDALVYQFTLEQSSAVNEPIRIHDTATTRGLLLDETDSDNIIGEDDSSSVGESILLETGTNDYLLQEEYIIGTGGANTGSLDNTAQNELFESLDDDVLDFTESNPFGDAGE
jgi:hypothetical protein|tara:strand:- start:1478 stop:2479 length:1002 start_codon:yes stop_codon:yes gene_type:complete